jgi:signal transduction histidine kinase
MVSFFLFVTFVSLWFLPLPATKDGIMMCLRLRSNGEGFLEIGRWNMPARDQTPSGEAEPTELQRLTEALALAERDRQLLGYEIHDGVVQDLTAAAMYLEGAGREAQFKSTETQEKFAAGLRLLRAAIAEMRRLIRGAQIIESNERGLVPALQQLADKFRVDRALPIELLANTADFALPASSQHLLLRIAQEALHNIWKHARANGARIELSADHSQLELKITDDGLGFDPALIPAAHIGLEGMRARARILGANLQINSRPGQGTCITITMPLDSSSS